jgi:hypothetical protein
VFGKVFGTKRDTVCGYYWIFYNEPFCELYSEKGAAIASQYSDGLRTRQPDLIPGRSKIFLFSTASKLALGLTHLPIQWVLGTILPGAKQQRHERVQEWWSYSSTPPYILMAWCLIT